MNKIRSSSRVALAFTSALVGLGGAACSDLPPVSAELSQPEPAAPEQVGSELVAAAGNAIGLGFNHTCVILEGGAVKCWGYNWAGALGLGHTNGVGGAGNQMSNALPTVQLGKGLSAKALAGGNDFTCAWLSNNQVKCWGENASGQLGLGDTVDRGSVPGQMGDNLPAVDLGTGRTAKAISAGWDFACAILDTNQVKCWGANPYGQLGIGDTRTRGTKPDEMGDGLPAVNLGAGRTAIAIANGDTFACALLDDQSVKCWGRNSYGQLGQGNTASVGSTQDSMTNLAPVNLGTNAKAKAISARGYTACALIDVTNQIKCWGYNSNAQLATGDLLHRGDGAGEMGDALPYINLGTGTTAKAVTVGSGHVCAQLDTPNPPPGAVNTNQIKCWGINWSGSLGLGDINPRGDTPGEMGDALPLVAIGQGRSARAISAGDTHTCVILDTNQVKCWGSSWSGQLGYGDFVDRGDNANEMGLQLPIVQLGTRGVVYATAGNRFACARLANGQLKCWGENGWGQLGLGDSFARGASASTIGDALPAVNLGTNRTVYSGAGAVIAAGDIHTCAVLDNRTVKCWGRNEMGSLGLGDVVNRGSQAAHMGDALPALNLGTSKLAIQLTAGAYHTCARLSTNEVKCWGLNTRGQLGLGDAANRGDAAGEMGDALPIVNLGTGKTATQVVAGRYFTCALVTGGQVKCWGDGQGGGIVGTTGVGDAAGEMGDALAPVPLGTGLTAKSIAAGGNHACAWLSNNQVKCWGDNTFGQLGQGDTVARKTVAQLGDALPVINLGTGRTSKGMFASDKSTCVVLDTNQIKCFGENTGGQLGLGDTRHRGDGPAEMGDYLPTLQLGAGRTVLGGYSGANAANLCVMLDNRHLKCWGQNSTGELGVGDIVARGATANMGDALPPVNLGAEM
jgi:alpha-tubulin suppressor-like RCC1 family protein